MKKILFLSLVFLPFMLSAQLNVQSHSEYNGYKKVCDIKCVACFGTKVGEIRFIYGSGYLLCGVTDNMYEETMANIFLGKTKSEAIKSLNDLKNIVRTYGPGTYVVEGFERTTRIIVPSTKLLATVIETDFVAGQSAVPYWLCYNDKKFNGYIEEVSEFNEEMN